MAPLSVVRPSARSLNVVRSAARAPLSGLRRARFATFATPEKVQSALTEALQAAEECVGDCAVEWDTVEELSAAANKTIDDQPAADSGNRISASDAAKIQMVAEAVKQAQASAEPTLETVKMLESAAAEMKKVEPKVRDDAKIATLETQLNDALDAAKGCVDDCATDWDTVEELSSALSKLKK
ncbi:hypothetical protein PPROV_000999100 [Pycnococcus provasolii]|uniref:Uncharacterized protein n=1 Tax=Pycnococcus provasolii TaxID=41880 RepID=A0A7R9XPT5_9CHLO|nr:hypothetical protein PPROV_000999100 [Pycnococcus provasolii]|mmetsp:Transcript_672/g.1512  ORF Transcript_672/g.1512 Transcript_672/m.1512 type:complete len:183 (+) Transcript_672:76-624(+)